MAFQPETELGLLPSSTPTAKVKENDENTVSLYSHRLLGKPPEIIGVVPSRPYFQGFQKTAGTNQDTNAHHRVNSLLSPFHVVTHRQKNLFFDGVASEVSERRIVLCLRFYGDDDRRVEEDEEDLDPRVGCEYVAEPGKLESRVLQKDFILYASLKHSHRSLSTNISIPTTAEANFNAPISHLTIPNQCIDEARTTVMTESAAAVEVMRFMVAVERRDDARDFVDRRRRRQNTILGFSLQLGFIDLGLSGLRVIVVGCAEDGGEKENPNRFGPGPS
ncbi:hypothetical protein V8G54_003271 [Vigna mungo]|uniref:Uncharacterized protein n=1 Tax=Vigna mungo TaxID=3915 RepID=A0AAQ3PD49_VIGMU